MLLSEKERENIRHRLRIGNSVKVIALNYSGIKGILDEIKDIRVEMNGAPQRLVMRVPEAPALQPQFVVRSVSFEAGYEGWYRALSPDLRKLVKEVCRLQELGLRDLLEGKGAKLARQMLCHALYRRWAMSYEEIGPLLGVSAATAKNYTCAWCGKKPIAEPPMPDVPKDALPVALAIAGEHGVSCLALVKSAGRRGLCDEARNHFAFRLYTELGYTRQDISRLFGCTYTNINGYLDAYIKVRGLFEDEVEKRHNP